MEGSQQEGNKKAAQLAAESCDKKEAPEFQALL